MRKWVVQRNGRIFGLLLVLLLSLQPTVIALSPLPQAPAQEPAPTDDMPDVATSTPTPDEETGGTVVTVPERATATPTLSADTQDDTAVPEETAVDAEPANTTGAPPGWFTSRDCSQALRVMPLGDSITAGRGSGPVPMQDSDEFLTGYRQPLDALLNAGNYSFNFVGQYSDGESSGFTFDMDHQGLPGQRIDQMIGLVAGYLTANPPDLILLHIGTNDVVQDDDHLSAISELGTLLNTIDSYDADIPIILARIIREEEGWPASVHKTYFQQYNLAIQNLANTRIANGDKLYVVDMEPALDYTNGSVDFINSAHRLHPNATGYSKMADVWFDGLDTIWPTCVEINSSPVLTVEPGQPYSYMVQADADPMNITYSLINPAPAGMIINANTGQISWTPTVSQIGNHHIQVQATNGYEIDTQQFTITVNGYQTFIPSIIKN